VVLEAQGQMLALLGTGEVRPHQQPTLISIAVKVVVDLLFLEISQTHPHSLVVALF
jgi:hypothetical protein